jgi:hypothetical protein
MLAGLAGSNPVAYQATLDVVRTAGDPSVLGMKGRSMNIFSIAFYMVQWTTHLQSQHHDVNNMGVSSRSTCYRIKRVSDTKFNCGIVYDPLHQGAIVDLC